MLRRKRITIDGNPPSLIHSRLGVTRHAINHGSKLGAEKENVDTTVDRNTVEMLGDSCFEPAMIQVADELAIDIDRSTTLVRS